MSCVNRAQSNCGMNKTDIGNFRLLGGGGGGLRIDYYREVRLRTEGLSMGLYSISIIILLN